MHFDIIYTGAVFATVIGGWTLNKWNNFSEAIWILTEGFFSLIE